MLCSSLHSSLLLTTFGGGSFDHDPSPMGDNLKPIKATLNLDAEILAKAAIKKIFVQISRIFLSDQILYGAMRADLDDLFYQEDDSEDWNIYNEICEE